jgi:hypothetical protein
VFALLLLIGLVERHHSVRIGVHVQMLGDEPGGETHRRTFVPHRVVEWPLRRSPR